MISEERESRSKVILVPVELPGADQQPGTDHQGGVQPLPPAPDTTMDSTVSTVSTFSEFSTREIGQAVDACVFGGVVR